MRRKAFLSALLAVTLCASTGVLLAALASSAEEPAAPAVQEHGPFRILSPQEREKVPAEERQLMTLSADGKTLRVDPGDRGTAEAYYAGIGAQFPHLARKCLDTRLLECDLPAVLAYFGYAPLVPKDLQTLAPEVLMDYGLLLKAVSNPNDFRGYPAIGQDELLVTRFFAPKIMSVRELPPKKDFGWRKLLWLKARRGSAAEADKLEAFYLLFNFFSDTPVFPEGKDAGQIQAMWTPLYPTTSHNSAYFFVFNALSGICPEADAQGNVVNKPCTPGKIGLHLTASFDANGLPQKNYFVPTACSQCHGTAGTGATKSKINYLDTDHWYDRVQKSDDFSQVNEADVLVKGGGPAMRVIHGLNSRIRTQNLAVDASDSFQVRAVSKWLELHDDCKDPAKCTDKHVPAIQRGFKRAGSDTVWSADHVADTKLLPLLNQNCFRCHSSFRYHVFEKKFVYDRRGQLKQRLDINMPPDRVLSPARITEMKALLDAIEP